MKSSGPSISMVNEKNAYQPRSLPCVRAGGIVAASMFLPGNRYGCCKPNEAFDEIGMNHFYFTGCGKKSKKFIHKEAAGQCRGRSPVDRFFEKSSA
ncbi:hypothetical protein [Desulfoluna spongiiphila]|uniref:hypothetical protein n=1 Tax=Desulfoluna spongiiphila TaxID=419481 RepID=UPI0011140D3B|nr:hypothetical protein [Desulfoluna spongiiphila]